MPTEQNVNQMTADDILPTAEGHAPADRGDADVIGPIRMSVAFAAPSPEGQARWAGRIDALTDWLLAEWRREHGETS